MFIQNLTKVMMSVPQMQVFHWSQQAGNYAFLESRDQCLHGRLGSVANYRLLGRVGEISNMFDISTTVADPCFRP